MKPGGGYGPETYGERFAEIYDELFHPPTAPEVTVEFLAGLAGDGPVLELAIGTGRIALPLAARGIEVHTASMRRQAPREAWRRRHPGHDRRLRRRGGWRDATD